MCLNNEQELSTQQIGKSSELLVQYRLLQRGVESAPMPTGSGVSLLAFSSKENNSFNDSSKN